MNIKRQVYATFGVWLLLFILVFQVSVVKAQTQIAQNRETIDESNSEKESETEIENKTKESAKKRLVISVMPNYYSQDDGISLDEIVNRAFENNGGIKIALLEVEKAKARLEQARLRQNPTLEVEQSSGRFVGSAGDGELSVGFALPLDVYNQRRKRINLAEAEITLKEAEIAA
ncbi:MAG: TolC family protein, partial [Acidobacteria bacterium]|nr:TolC family protein [Acidobacteriota bacterium]